MVGSLFEFENDMNKDNIIKLLESILTNDGKGRSSKARLLLSLLEEAPSLLLLQSLKEIGERKF